MRFSPTKLLHGLLYTAPVILLTLVACGGGGSTPSAPLAVYHTIGGTVTGLTGGTIVLRNNGGDDKNITGDGSYTFSTAIIAGGNYNVTVLTHPSSPIQRCSVTSPSGSNLSGSVTSADVTCSPAYTIGGNSGGGGGITGLIGIGLVLQNNGADNLLIASAVSPTPFAFSTPVFANPASNAYAVTVLSQPHTPAQTCTTDVTAIGNAGADVSDVLIACVTDSLPPTPPAPDRFIYAANYNNNNVGNVSAYTIDASSGVVLTSTDLETAENGPSSIAVDSASRYAYVTNQGSNDISVFSINGTTGALTKTDADSSIAFNQDSILTGTNPVAIKIHPSGKFAYVVNKLSNSVSAYTIDAATDPVPGALAKIDANGTVSGTDIATGLTPVSIAIDPAGNYAYVVNVGANAVNICGHGGSPSAKGCISAYSIDTYGVLTQINATLGSINIDTETTPTSVTVDPSGDHLYVTNAGSDNISTYSITAGTGALTASGALVATGTGPGSITVHPSGKFAYVVNTNAYTVWVYSITAGTGALSHALVATMEVATGNLPVSISIDSTGQYAFVANSGTSNDVSVYSIDYDTTTDGGTGGLTLVGSYSNGGTNPRAVITAQ